MCVNIYIYIYILATEMPRIIYAGDTYGNITKECWRGTFNYTCVCARMRPIVLCLKQ